MRAAIYTRVSTEEQVKEGLSLEFQERDCREYAAKLGYTVVEVYSDPGYSGVTDSRPDLDRLRRDAEAHKFDVLITWKFDRLFRVAEFQKREKRLLAEEGIVWKSVQEGFDIYSPVGNLQHTIMGSFSEWERDVIRERTSAGRRQKALRGRQSNPTGKPYGYRIITKLDGQLDPRYAGRDGEYEIVPKEAEVVKRIYALYLGGFSLWEISRNLASEGHKSARGGQWRPNILSYILHNSTYAGTAHHHRYLQTKRRNPRTGEYCQNIVERDQEEWVPIPVPAIVSREDFDRVQTIFRENQKKRSGRPDRVYPLSSLIRCSECGHNYNGSYHQKSQNRYYRSHVPQRPDETFACEQANMIRADDAENGVLGLLSEVAKHPDLVYGALESYWAEEDRKAGNREDRRRLEEALAKVERQLRAIIEKEIEEPEMGQIYADMKAEKKAQRQTLIERLSSLPTQPERPQPPGIATIEGVCAELSRRLAGITEPQVMREVFLHLIEEVEVLSDGTLLVRIYGNKLFKRLPPYEKLNYTGKVFRDGTIELMGIVKPEPVEVG